jgi:hypothetical protein
MHQATFVSILLPSAGKDGEVLAHDRLEADKQGTRHEGVADGHLVESREIAEKHQVVQIEIVAGVDAEAERPREPGRFRVHRKGAARFMGTPFEGPRERLCVKLHAVCAD